MKIRKIVTIKKYKSFVDFEWRKFCKSWNNTNKENPILEEIELSKFNVIFGENGSGKSSICCILKNLSDNHNFTKSIPSLLELEIKDSTSTSTYKFENSKWNKVVPKDSIVFFDNDFIDDNVHTHGRRENTQAKHNQNSGRLIIDLDQKANTLKLDLNSLKEESELFKSINAKALAVVLLPNEQAFFDNYDQLDDVSVGIKKSEIIEVIRKNEKSKVELERLLGKYSQIVLIHDIRQVPRPTQLSDISVYTKIFNKHLKERTLDSTDETIKKHFNEHKKFIEEARKEIPQDYNNRSCPLCMQPLSNASQVIEFYRQVFDQSYEVEKQKYFNEIDKLKNELLTYKSFTANVLNSISTTYNQIEKIAREFDIEKLYDIQRKEKFLEKITNMVILNEDLDKLVDQLNGLKSIERDESNFESLYDLIYNNIKTIGKLIISFNIRIGKVNIKINEFKLKYTDKSKIDTEKSELTLKIKKLNEELDFINTNKVALIKEKNKLIKQRDELTTKYKDKQNALTIYLSEKIPSSVLDQMLYVLKKFNLSFTLKQLTSSANTKDYTFDFSVMDVKGNERELKDGLSEGERQVISLAFFLSYIENIQDKSNKIIIFDDPITSLDSPNLKILADLLHTSTKPFGQVIVLTHHALFQKYLAKCTDPNPMKFGVLKNDEKFGGSFIHFDPGYNLNEELFNCDEEINQRATTSTFQPEEIALKYGQLLRLSVEKFIKNELLMWDRENNFDQITGNLKQSKSKIGKLTDEDLEAISNIYKYCNYSNLMHADKENPSTLNELRNHITNVVNIIKK